MELLIHIGTGKTGSSSIQRVLKNNRTELQRSGLFYAGYMFDLLEDKDFSWQRHSGTEEFNRLSESQRKKQLSKALKRSVSEAQSKGCTRILWSNEALCNMPYLVPLLDALWHGEVTIISFVRRHDDYSISAYKQWGLKHKIYPGELLPYEAFFKRFPVTFYDRLSLWNTNDWQFHILNYHCCNNVVESFFQTLTIPTTDIDLNLQTNVGESLAQLFYHAIQNSALENAADKGNGREFYQPQYVRDAKWLYSKLPTQAQVDDLFQRTEQDRQKLNTLLPADQQFETAPAKCKLYSEQEVEDAYHMVFSYFVDKIVLNDRTWKKQFKANQSVVTMENAIHAQGRQINELTAQLNYLQSRLGITNSLSQRAMNFSKRVLRKLYRESKKALNWLVNKAAK